MHRADEPFQRPLETPARDEEPVASSHSSDSSHASGTSGEGDAALESLLRTEDLLPVPVALVSGVLDLVRAEPPAAWERAATTVPAAPARPALVLPRWARAAAAAVLVTVGAWLTLGGVEPVAAAADSVTAAVDASLGVRTDGIRLPLAATDAREPLASLGSLFPARPTAPDAIAARAAHATPGGGATLVAAGALFLAAAAVAARRRLRAPPAPERAPRSLPSSPPTSVPSSSPTSSPPSSR